ncbi:MAG: phosphoenolpyruvate synthase [Desulfovibrionaceae bacterium]|nr:phosphoenolpyruvate synthase [Desulfovibrionaceae bacterium]
MGMFEFWQRLLRRKPDPEKLALQQASEEALAQKIRLRCSQFRRLLARNKTALELMSDLEEHLGGAKQFGMDYIRGTGAKISAAVYQMVQCLDELSNGQYQALQTAFDNIAKQIEGVISYQRKPVDLESCPLILALEDIRLTDTPYVGGKMANLGEIHANVGLPVPAGFAITVQAYDHFMQANNLAQTIAQKIQSADLISLDATMHLSQELQHAILNAPLPADLEAAIKAKTQELQEQAGEDVLLALRSSAVGEDAKETTFAGQYRSELNVPPEEVCHVYKEIIASKYSLSAMSYRFQHGIPDDATPMCVGVLEMVKAAAGGVAYSRDPVQCVGEQRIVINAVAGLPQGVVDGGVIPDVFFCSREPGWKILEKRIADPRGAGVLRDEQILNLAKVALALEEFYAEPQDVEWAFDQDGELSILQSRPLQVTEAVEEEDAATTSQEEQFEVLLRGGIPASPGVSVGKPYILRKEADMLSFPAGCIMVVERAFPRWATLLPRASGLISEAGGTAGHLASVAREYHIPALFSLKDACKVLSEQEAITLDASRALVFAGLHHEIEPKLPVANSSIKESRVYQRLTELAKLITPLHLLDPTSPDFRPENCTSLHDITRFCHEKSVNLLFLNEDTQGQKIGKQLQAGKKLQYWVVDMGHAFKRQISGSVVDIKDIASYPMLALWEGMTAIPWYGPPAAGAAGFMSVVLQSTMNPELESTAPTTMTERNFFIIDAGYMILQARYGYHFCTVECQSTSKRSENFVTFQFKGGAADRERRILRVKMLASLLEEFQFRVDVREDALFAVAEGFSYVNILKRTELLGYLLLHSRQSDTIMLEVERAQAFKTKLLTDMQTLFQQDLQCIANLDQGTLDNQ